MIGEPKTEIIRKVSEVKADVLIMGSRNMGTIKRSVSSLVHAEWWYIYEKINIMQNVAW